MVQKYSFFVCNKVCTNCFRVVVHDDRPYFLQMPMYSVRNRNRTRFPTDTDAPIQVPELFLSRVSFYSFTKYRIVVRCLCRKFCCTRIHDLVCRNSVCMTHRSTLCLSCQLQDHVIRELHPFCFFLTVPVSVFSRLQVFSISTIL